jgi:hypothetical protein
MAEKNEKNGWLGVGPRQLLGIPKQVIKKVPLLRLRTLF